MLVWDLGWQIIRVLNKSEIFRRSCLDFAHNASLPPLHEITDMFQGGFGGMNLSSVGPFVPRGLSTHYDLSLLISCSYEL